MGQGETSAITKQRKAKAGLLMMGGANTAEALIKVGYAESTAKAPKRNGLNADQCLKAAAEVYPAVAPIELLELTRELFKKKVTELVKKPSNVKLGEISRALEVCERYHGERTPEHHHARDAGERLAYLSRVLDAYKQHGGDVAALAGGLVPQSKVSNSDSE